MEQAQRKETLADSKLTTKMCRSHGERTIKKKHSGAAKAKKIGGTSGSLVILSWNFCGLENPITFQRLREIQRKNDLHIVFLMEMVVKELHWLQTNNSFAVPPHTPRGGGLFLSWKRRY